MKHKNNKTGCGTRYCLISVIVILVFFIFIQTGSANYLGNVTIFVKDQNGNNVNCYYNNPDPTFWLGCQNRIYDNLTIELRKSGELVNSTTMPNDRDSVLFQVNQTGSYVVRAFTTLSFKDYYTCFLGKPGADSSNDYSNCEVACPDLSREYEPSNGTQITTYSTFPEQVDDRGAYYCLNMNCIPDGSGTSVMNCTYTRDHRYAELNEVLTYVDKGESDVAQVTLGTDRDILGGYGKLYSDTLLNGSKLATLVNLSNGTDSPYNEGKYAWVLSKLRDKVFDYGAGKVVDGLAKGSPYFKHLFDKSAFGVVFKNNIASTVIVFGVAEIADPLWLRGRALLNVTLLESDVVLRRVFK